MKQKQAKQFFETLKGFRVAVVGDVILDRYIWGHASRISPEAPVPVVRVARRTGSLGGAANVMRNLASLGMQPVAFGVLGHGDATAEVLHLCERWNIDSFGLERELDRKTSVKIRLISDNQQIARIDEETDTPISESATANLAKKLRDRAEAGELDAILLEDYNKGVLTQALVDEVVDIAAEHDLLVALDPHPGNRLKLGRLSLMTPNRNEAFAMASKYQTAPVTPVEQDTALAEVGEILAKDYNAENLLITLGGGGMALFHSNGDLTHIPTVAREVFDVSGAGDTVIATCLAGMLAGLAPAEAAYVANQAAGIVVGKIGTVSVSADELLERLLEG